MKLFIALSLTLMTMTAQAGTYSCVTERNEAVELHDNLNVEYFSPTSDEGEKLACVQDQDAVPEMVTYKHGAKPRAPGSPGRSPQLLG